MKVLLSLSLYLAFSISAWAQAAAANREGDVDVGDAVAIHYVDGGARDAKTTILFIPGWSMSSAVWRDQMARFAATARVVAIDPRSQGQSTITTKSNTRNSARATYAASSDRSRSRMSYSWAGRREYRMSPPTPRLSTAR